MKLEIRHGHEEDYYSVVDFDIKTPTEPAYKFLADFMERSDAELFVRAKEREIDRDFWQNDKARQMGMTEAVAGQIIGNRAEAIMIDDFGITAPSHPGMKLTFINTATGEETVIPPGQTLEVGHIAVENRRCKMGGQMVYIDDFEPKTDEQQAEMYKPQYRPGIVKSEAQSEVESTITGECTNDVAVGDGAKCYYFAAGGSIWDIGSTPPTLVEEADSACRCPSLLNGHEPGCPMEGK